MTTQRPANRTFEESLEDLKAEDPDLRQALEEDEGAFVVARELLRCRREAGISQTELAKRMGTTQPVISRLERMETDPSIGQVFRAARALGKKPVLRFEDARAVEATPETLTTGMRLHAAAGSGKTDALVRLLMDASAAVERGRFDAVRDLFEEQVMDSFRAHLADLLTTEGLTFRVKLPKQVLSDALDPELHQIHWPPDWAASREEREAASVSEETDPKAAG